MFEDLYGEVIIDHSKRPRNCRPMADANRCADGHNRLCGDKLRLYLKLEGDCVADVSFEGSGCAISTAAASLMTETVKGKTRAESLAVLERFHEVLMTDGPVSRGLGKLVVFCGVRQYPARVKCATLAGHTLKSALLTTTVTSDVGTSQLVTTDAVTTE
jgi:nitrogen fixation protein NifU and related proteins